MRLGFRFALSVALLLGPASMAQVNYLQFIMLHFLSYLPLAATIGLPRQSPVSTGVARPCATGWNIPRPDQNKKRPRNANEESQKGTGACVELAFSPLEIQEYLQSFVRKQQWKIADEHVSEDSWTFSRELSRDELLNATKNDPAANKVDWTKGMAVVHVNTMTLANGLARTVIRANFRGYGQNADQFAMRREYWKLESNNSLEAFLISALTDHFKPPQ